MTMQIPEDVVYRGQSYALAGYKGNRRELFSARDHGFHPAGITTALHRGYICTYKIVGERLTLDKVNMGPSEPGTRHNCRPTLFGKESEGDGHGFLFTKLAHEVDFTGRLLVCRDRGERCCGPLPFGYNDVHELTFERGRFIDSKDRSGEMPRINASLHAVSPDIPEWLNEYDEFME